MKISAKRYAKALYESTHDASAKEREAIIARFVALLAKRNSLSSIESIIAEYREHSAKMAGTVDVHVTVARKLSAAAEKIFSSDLSKRLKKDVIVHTHIDPALIGGAVISYGDTIIDGSVTRAIADLKESLAS